MSDINNCFNPCPTIQSVAIPGPVGAAGAAGPTGPPGLAINTTLSAQFTIVAPPATSTISILTNVTCSVGENIWINWISGITYGANFVITAVNPNGVGITVMYAGVSGDAPVGTVVPANATVTVSVGNLTFPLSIANGGTNAITAILALQSLGVGYAATTIYGAGTVYTLTTSSALLNVGTNPPALTIPRAGTYLIFANAGFAYVGASYASGNYVAATLYNSTAAATLSGSAVSHGFPGVTTATCPAFVLPIPVISYTSPTPFVAETIQLRGQINAALGAGSITCTQTSIIAVKIY